MRQVVDIISVQAPGNFYNEYQRNATFISTFLH